MTTHSLKMIANARPETLERILRVVRHRGFRLVSLNAEQNEAQLQLVINVQSPRDISLLINQLTKLEDVVSVG